MLQLLGILIDNTGSIAVSSGEKITRNACHIDIRYHHIRDLTTWYQAKVTFSRPECDPGGEYAPNTTHRRLHRHAQPIQPTTMTPSKDLFDGVGNLADLIKSKWERGIATLGTAFEGIGSCWLISAIATGFLFLAAGPLWALPFYFGSNAIGWGISLKAARKVDSLWEVEPFRLLGAVVREEDEHVLNARREGSA